MTSPRLLTGILHPLYELATGRRIRDKLRPAERRQWWTREALLDYQWQEIVRLLEHAYANVPFYRRRFAEVGLTPRDIRSPEELAILPPLTKEDIQQHGSELVARDLAAAGPARRRATGGSTGQNLTFFNDQRSLDYRTAAAIRSDALCGMHQGARQAKLWGSPDDARRARRLGYWLADRLQNRIYLDAFDLTSGAMRAFAAQLQRFRPEAILGYATCLHAFALFLEREGIRIPPPRTVISSAETLHDAQRTVIERALGCAVHNRYGCREMGPIAAECDRHRGLHVFADERLVEVVSGGRPAVPGEPGELIVTDLRNYAMPFIRYRIGDVGEVEAGTCDCGRGFPLLARVIGRTSDLIVAPDGRLIHGEYFTHLFYFQHAVASFRVHQPRLENLEVTVVPAAGAAPDLEAIGAAVRHAMGPGVEVEVRTASALPPAPSGKLRFTTSAVPHDFLTTRGSGHARAA